MVKLLSYVRYELLDLGVWVGVAGLVTVDVVGEEAIVRIYRVWAELEGSPGSLEGPGALEALVRGRSGERCS